MFKARIILPFLSLILFANCKHDCINTQIELAFIGFPEASVNTLVLKKFVQNDSFNHFVDSLIITDKYHQTYYISNDTILVYTNSFYPTDFVNPNHDWQVYLPGDRKNNYYIEYHKSSNKHIMLEM